MAETLSLLIEQWKISEGVKALAYSPQLVTEGEEEENQSSNGRERKRSCLENIEMAK